MLNFSSRLALYGVKIGELPGNSQLTEQQMPKHKSLLPLPKHGDAAILAVNTSLPGLRLQGGCAAFSNDALTAEQNTTSFLTFCDNSPPLDHDQVVDMNISFGNANVTSSSPNSTATAYIFFQTSNGSVDIAGMVRCQSNFSLSTASLSSGASLTYNAFLSNVTYRNLIPGVGIADPLSATLAGLNLTLGSSNVNFAQPSLDIFANRIWLGVAHMTAGIGLLSTSSDTPYDAPITLLLPGRKRSTPGLVVSLVLGYRSSIDSGIGSRVAAFLHAKDSRIHTRDDVPLQDFMTDSEPRREFDHQRIRESLR
ncbi:hypothetical protein BU17DRAFT_78768 [Hysterangium stoloniferum]|nr:hypothetical protein BU17DRAFT_78768 [Hysterangium stoloniferum]